MAIWRILKKIAKLKTRQHLITYFYDVTTTCAHAHVNESSANSAKLD